MSKPMHQFTTVGHAMPEKRKPEERSKDFGEIYQGYPVPKAAEQSSRCEQCGIPFCQVHCPLQNNIPDWLKLVANDRMEEAYEVSSATNNFPEITGRICPQDRLCEGGCVLEQSRHNTVTIGSVEKFITDHAFEQDWVKPIKPRVERAESVGIIGAGPGGMAAAEQLRKKGYQVTVYDRHDRVGGLLVYGIPNFKLDKTIVERRAKLMADSGVTFRMNFEVGRDASLADLRTEHDALLIATGVYKATDLSIPGNDLGNVVQALDYLIASNKQGLGDTVEAFDSGALNAEGKNVVVVGGGDTAMDCVRTALRQGAKSVKCLYRRDRANMPGSAREVHHAEEEGADFVWLASPLEFNGDDGVVDSVTAVEMHLGLADESGRQTPQPIDGSDYDLPADLVIKALGFGPENLPELFGEPELAVDKWGTLPVDAAKMTNLPGVFAAGDIVRGASLVVWAIRDGRDAADGIHRYIETNKVQAAE